MALRLQQARGDQAAQVAGGSAIFDPASPNLTRPPDAQPHRRIEEGIERTLRHTVLGEQGEEFLTDDTCLRETASDGLGLHVMSAQAELHPEVSISFRVPPAACGHCEDAVVVLGIGSQPLLDTVENGLYRMHVGQDQSLQGSGHAPVAIAERVDHHQVEMCHGRPHQSWGGAVAGETVGERIDQGRRLAGVRPGVDTLASALPLDEDLTLAGIGQGSWCGRARAA